MKIDIKQTKTKRIDISHLAIAGPGDYITVKKIDRATRNKIQLFAAGTNTAKFSQFMSDRLRKGEVKPEDFANDEDLQRAIMEMYAEMDQAEIEKASTSALLIERETIESGLDQDEHSIEDLDGKRLALNYDTVALLGDDFLRYVISEINAFNAQGAAFSLGKSTPTNADM
jgi:hypothetical protein